MSFFEMGGYAAYIWPAFGVGALVLIGLLVISLRRAHLVKGGEHVFASGVSASVHPIPRPPTRRHGLATCLSAIGPRCIRQQAAA